MLMRWGGWFALILLALATSWLLYNMQEESGPDANNAYSLPDYMLRDFTTTQMDEQGLLKSHLTATTMLHYPDRNTELTAPYMIFYTEQQPDWHVQAQRGEVSPDGNQIWLMGDTVLWRDSELPAKRVKILSQDVKIQLDTNYAETAAPTTVYHAHGETHSIGMQVFMPLRQVKLLSQVRGHYDVVKK